MSKGAKGGPTDPDSAADRAKSSENLRRRDQRRSLRELRDGIEVAERADLDTAIVRGLDSLLAAETAGCIAGYWPLCGEPDLRAWYRKLAGSALTLALPVVVGRQQPLVFRAWQMDAALVRDALNIPCPAAAESVVPDVIIVPCVGFDPAGFRLGSGGGYYDRTLATFARMPTLIGVAYQRLLVSSIVPQAHDIPLDFIVTEKRIYARSERHEQR